MTNMTRCKTCSMEIATNSKFCTECGAKNFKKIYKRWWFWALIIVIFISVIGGEEDNVDTINKVDINKNESIESNSQIVEEIPKEEVYKEETEEKESIVKKEESIPTEYKSALKKAEIYSDTKYMSKSGIYKHLTSEYGEKFSAEAAQYAIDNVEADWKGNALKRAKSYSDHVHMSKVGIYDILTSEHVEQFSVEEAQYAIDNVEANWNENALEKAYEYQKSMSTPSPSVIYDQLVSKGGGEKFTHEEAQYAIDNLQ